MAAWTRWVALSQEAPVWTGPARRIRLHRHGDVHGLRVTFITSPRVAAPPPGTVIPRSPSGRGSSRAQDGTPTSQSGVPTPTYASELKMVFVHHTDTATSAPCSDSARIVRGIYAYHVRTNGWNDIGYNFLVDKCGTVFEGRYGGMTKPVIGAQTKGFNTGSAGIAIIGTYSSARPRPAAVAALERLIAWRLDVAHVDPASRVDMVSSGNPRYRAGRHVVINAVSGSPQRLPDLVPRIGALCPPATHPGGGPHDRAAEDLGAEPTARTCTGSPPTPCCRSTSGPSSRTGWPSPSRSGGPTAG